MHDMEDDTAFKVAVLRALRRWGTLPESDLSRLVRPHMLVTNNLRDMAEEGLLDMAFIGDEYVISFTTYGRLYLEQEEPR